MKKILYISIILIVASCSKFLEPQSQTEYVPRDINALSELLIGKAYLDPTNTAFSAFGYNEILTDDWACTIENCVNTNNESRYTKYKAIFAWHPDMFKLSNDLGVYYNIWKTYYEYILGCNAVLDYLDKVEGSIDEKNYVKGQALALRSFYYFNLVNLFGEPYNYNKKALGVPLKLNSNLDVNYPSRATVEEVYTQMVKDLNEAEAAFSLLPNSKQFIKDGRVTMPMIQLMQARVALFMEDYDKVITYGNKVINEWGLKLLDLNSFVSTPAQPYYSFTNYSNPEAIWLFGCSQDMYKFTTEYIYKLPNSTSQTRRMFNASPSLLNSFETSDLRKNNYILKESTTVSNYVPAGKLPVGTTYLALSTEFGRAFRLSEAYVMLAEAYYMKNRPQDAVTILESLRIKRFNSNSGNEYKVPSGSETGTALYNFIKSERRREMCFEGLRWYDLRRWGMESFSREWKEEGVVVATFTMEKNDPAYTLPIPFDVIDLNPNLVQNKLSTPKY